MFVRLNAFTALQLRGLYEEGYLYWRVKSGQVYFYSSELQSIMWRQHFHIPTQNLNRKLRVQGKMQEISGEATERLIP